MGEETDYALVWTKNIWLDCRANYTNIFVDLYDYFDHYYLTLLFDLMNQNLYTSWLN